MKKYIVSFVIILVAAFVAFVLPEIQMLKSGNLNDNLTVTFIDVGQGDCSLISIGGKSLLIDGGEYESWEDDIQPFMLENGYNRFNNVMVSHYHSDHGGGIHELVEAGMADRLIMPDTEDTGNLKNKLIKATGFGNTEVVDVLAGDSIDIGNPNVKLNVLFPDRDMYVNEEENLNNDSIVLRLDYYDTSFLFTGDLESDAEAVLVNSGLSEADLLKVGHHGSKTSTSKAFLEAVNPDYAVIQAGENNSYGHPHDKVVKRIRDFGAMIYRTDRNGDIVFEVDEKGIVKIEPQYR